MKRPLAYITAPWSGNRYKDLDKAARFCRAVYEAGFSPVCPQLYMTMFVNTDTPEGHKDMADMGRDLLRRSRVLVVCGNGVNEIVKSDIAYAARLKITATTLDGILTVQGQGKRIKSNL